MPKTTKTTATKAAAAPSKRTKAGTARPTKASPSKAKAPAKASVSKAKAPAKAAPAAKRAAGAAKPVGKRATGAAKNPAVLDRFTEEQRVLLLAEREEYVHQAQSLKEEAERLAEDMEPGDIQFDEESGEGATMNVERERDLALSAQARSAVDDIDRALEKITKGTYGICEQCGQPIPKARLKAIPQAALCVACKSGGLSRR